MQETWRGKECRQGRQERLGQDVVRWLLRMRTRPHVDKVPRAGPHWPERVVYRIKTGHIVNVCTEAAAARAAFTRNCGKPSEFEQTLLKDDEGHRDRETSPEKQGAGYRDRDRDR